MFTVCFTHFQLGAHASLRLLNFFFYLETTIEIYTLSLHDALPISRPPGAGRRRDRIAKSQIPNPNPKSQSKGWDFGIWDLGFRSEEHTSELHYISYAVFCLKKKKKPKPRCTRTTIRTFSKST